jgi:hypothetical protein
MNATPLSPSRLPQLACGPALVLLVLALVLLVPGPARAADPGSPGGPAGAVAAVAAASPDGAPMVFGWSVMSLVDRVCSLGNSQARLIQLGVVVMCVALYIMMRAAKY